MKKLWIIGTLAALALIAFGVVGYAYAQSQDDDSPEDGISYGCGMSGTGRGMMRMFNADQGEGSCGFANGDGEYGPLHDYMFTAFAQALGLTPEEIETRRQAGDTLSDMVQEQNLTAEEFQELVTTARTSAINQAVADGVITQAQADFMLERMERMAENAFGPGSGAGNGGCRHNGGGRGNNQP